MSNQWSNEVRETLEVLAKLPVIRYAFIPGFDRSPEGNSMPGSRLVYENGELALQHLNGTPTPLREAFDGYGLSVVEDMHGYKCVQGVNQFKGVREIAPCLPAYYATDSNATAIIRNELTITPELSKWSAC
jgi:hypothetical protein